MKRLSVFLMAMFIAMQSVWSQTIPATIPWTCNFEDPTENVNWIFDNGLCTNQWVIGTAVSSGAISGNSLYISNDNGASNTYTVGSTGSHNVVIAAREIESYGAEEYTLSFDFKCAGESSYDFVRVFLVEPGNNTFVASNSASAAGCLSNAFASRNVFTEGSIANVITTNTLYPDYSNILNGYNGPETIYYTNTQHIEAVLPSMGAAGTVKKLIIVWRQDGSDGTQPPAALDNFSISPNSCPAPTLTAPVATLTDAFIEWTAVPEASEYVIQWKPISISSWNDPVVETGATTNIFFTVTNLTHSTYYNVRVRSVCTPGIDSSFWATTIFTSNCDIITVTPFTPFMERFENDWRPAAGVGNKPSPLCWTVIDKGVISTTNEYWWKKGTTPAHDGTGHAVCYTDYGSSSHNDWLITPQIALTGNERLRFWAMRSSATTDEPDEISVFVSEENLILDTAAMGQYDTLQGFHRIFNQLLPKGDYVQYEINLSQYTGNRYVAFVRQGTPNGYNLRLDDVEISTIPSCLPVINSEVVNITHEEATVSWTSSGSEWLVQYKKASVASWEDVSVQSIPVYDTAYTLQGLDPNTDYDVRIRTICGTSNVPGENFSEWVKKSFRTVCVPLTLVDIPYWENFDTYPSGANLAAFPNCWTRNTNYSTAYYPYINTSAVVSAPNALYFSYGTTNYHTAAILTPLDPSIDVTTLRLQFKMRYSTVYSAGLQVGIMTDPNNWSTFVPMGDPQVITATNTWENKKVTFMSYNDPNPSGLHYIAIATMGTNTMYAYVDDLVLDFLPACPAVERISYEDLRDQSVTISWFSPATNFLLEYKTANVAWTDASVQSVSVGNTFYTISGLNPQTQYDVRVRTACGTGDVLETDFSEWKNISMATVCAPLTAFDLPYTENFDGVTAGATLAAKPSCWERNTNYSTNYYPYVSTSSSFSGANSLYFYYGNTSSHTSMILTPISSSIDVSLLRLRFKMRYSTLYSAGLQVGVMTNPKDWSTFVPIGDPQVITATGVWENKEIIFDSYNDPNPQIFHYIVIATMGTGSMYAYVDDLALDFNPECPDVYGFNVNNFGTANSATISWDTSAIYADQSGWTLAYDQSNAAGFDPSTATNTVTFTVEDMPYFLSGLTAGETYTFAMQSACDGNWTIPIEFTIPEIKSVPYTQNFEDTTNLNEWILYSDAINAWTIGSATGNPGNSLYVSNNSGINHAYSHAVSHAIASACIDFGNYAEYTLSFDWRCQGESAAWDRMQVWIVPAALALPTTWSNANDWITATNAYLIGNYFGQNSWTTNPVSVNIPSSFAGTIGRLVFMWYNDASGGSQAPAAVDNISLTGLNCGSPYNITVDAITSNSADITWTSAGTATNWWLYYTATDSEIIDSVYVSGTPEYQLTNLLPRIPYQIWLKTDCGSDGMSNYSATYSFYTACAAISTFPYIQNFDNCPNGATLAAFPNCWTRNTNYSSQYYPYVTNSTAVSGNQSLYWYNPSTANIYMGAIAPVIDSAIDVSTLRVRFKMRYSSIQTTAIQVGVMTDPADISTFVPVGSPQTLSAVNTWEDKEVPLSSYIPANPNNPAHYIALYTINNASQACYYYIDDFEISEIPDCPDVYNFAVNMVSNSSVTISWNETYQNSTESGWTIAYSIANPNTFDPATATNTVQVSAIDRPYTIDGLLAGTSYMFSMQTSCGGAFSNPIQIITPAAVPYTTDFEDAMDNLTWIKKTYNTANWEIGTSVGNPGASAYISTDGGTTVSIGSNPSYVWMYKDIDFGTTPSVWNLSFDWMCEGYSTSGWYSGIMVYVRDVSQTTLPVAAGFPTWVNDNTYPRLSIYGSNTWQTRTLQLNNMSGVKRIMFLWFRTTASNVPISAAIDNVSISLPNCITPYQHFTSNNSTFSSVELSWGSTGADSYILSYREDETGSTLMHMPATDTTVQLSGLNPATNYLYAVRAICGADTSVYSSTYQFTTECNVVNLPYTDGFESVAGTTYTTAGPLPSCWYSTTNNTSYPAPHVTGSGGYHYPHDGTNALTFTAGAAGNDAYAVLPKFSENIANMTISFWYKYENADCGTLSVGYITGNQDDLSTFVPLDVVPAAVAFYQFTYDFSTATADLSNATYIVLHWHHTTLFYSCGIDDINVTANSVSCSFSTALASSAVTANTATVSWTASATALSYTVEYKQASASSYVAMNNITDTATNLTGLLCNTLYDVRVKSKCAGDMESDYVQTSFSTANCSQETYIITATATANGSIDPSGDVQVNAGDDIAFTFTPNTACKVLAVNVDGVVVDSTAYPNNIYTFTNVLSNHSIHVDFSPVGIDSYGNSNIRIYPNPTSGKLKIESANANPEINSIEVYDLTGKKLSTFNFSFSTQEIDVSHLSSGMYFLKIGNTNIKFVKE